MRFSKSILVAAVTIVAPFLSHATPVTPSPSLSIGGLNFNDFTCSLSKGGQFADPGGCSKVNINTITQPGMGIQISSGFTAALHSFDDAVINYNVASNMGINSVGLDFNGTFEGLGISQVTESVFSGKTLVGFAEVSCDLTGCNHTQNILLNGTYGELHIEKDIFVAAALGASSISIVDQTFGTTATPEPSSLMLLGSSLVVGAGCFLRRRKTASAKA